VITKFSVSTSTNSTANTQKYTRLPNGMIINNDIESLKKNNEMLAKVNL